MKHTWWKYITKLVGGLNSCSVPPCDIKPKWLMCIHMCGLLSNHHDLLLIVRFLVCSYLFMNIPPIDTPTFVGFNVIIYHPTAHLKKKHNPFPLRFSWRSSGVLQWGCQGWPGWTIVKKPGLGLGKTSPTIAIHEYPSTKMFEQTVGFWETLVWLQATQDVHDSEWWNLSRVVPTRDGSG